jgi:tetratricopeptide (TPR) repeat protein
MRQQDLNIIDQYLIGTLSELETIEFDHRLQSDDKFRGQFEQFKLIISGIQYSARIDAIAKIKQIENAMPKIVKTGKPKNLKLLNPYIYYAVAGCLFICLVFSLFYLNYKGKHENNKTLFSAYFEPYPNVAYPATRYVNDSLTIVQKAFAAYDQKNYNEANEFFKAIPGYEKDPTISFYLAVTYMAINDCKNAEKFFLKLLNKNQAINDKVLWYLALSYLEENNTTKAAEYLQQLTVTQNIYTENATKILKNIK